MKSVSSDVSFPEIEERLIEYWRESDIFQRSMNQTNPDGTPREHYVFYDGPPFATGLPHYGHLLAGTIKDVIGRYFSMKGYHVDRRFGWDCHGMPVEFEIQKAFSLYGAKAIREFGVDRFNEECRKIVLRYTKEWERFVERSGRWADFNRQYRTMDRDFMESVWWAVKSLFDQGLIYEGLKCVPYSWAMNTTLSNFEVNLNYRQVQDPAVTVRLKLLPESVQKLGLDLESDATVSALIWTTTPWTLPSNMALAVSRDITYSAVYSPDPEEVTILASDLLSVHFPGLEPAQTNGQAANGHQESLHRVIGQVPGSKLEGLRYEPLFPYFQEESDTAFTVYHGDFVSAEEGTGIVHCASFGEDDLGLFLENDVPVFDPVDEDGRFKEVVSDYAGMQVKEADPLIIRSLKERGALFNQATISHSYPFCWRTDTPLIYKSISTWFVKVEELKEELFQNNQQIAWVPGHIKDGRFGNWLENARDWAISRNRFWGTPIPVWRCDSCGSLRCIGSVAELEELSGEKFDDIHGHFIDHIEIACADCVGKMRRVPEVLDCWFESGSMPYAQAHYPFSNRQQFEENFPADFIAEGLDQTRGWFYTLLVLSTALFKRPAFQNVIVNGIVLAEDGKKMSKSLRNYPPVDDIMNEFGADAMRLYLLSSPATRAEDLRFSKQGVRDVVRQTLLPLWNAYNFLVTYATVDNWEPSKEAADTSPNLLDRWIISKVGSLIEGVDYALSTYHLYAALPPILDFVDQLTNWYIRLNRRRFWVGNSPEEKRDKEFAYATLHRVLLLFTRVLAPLAPFVSEEIFRNLAEKVTDLNYESVHLNPFPSIDELSDASIQPELEQAMELFEEIILLGRGLRNDEGIKLRQPLPAVTVVCARQHTVDNLRSLDAYIRDELNVKQVHYTTNEERFVTLSAQLNTRKLGSTLGPELGSEGMKKLRNFVQALSSDQIRQVEDGASLNCAELELNHDIELGLDDIIIRRNAKKGVKTTSSSGQITIQLDTALTAELRLEGVSRDFINRVQKLRKESGFDVSDRIGIQFMTACPRITEALAIHRQVVMDETLAVELEEVSSVHDTSGDGPLSEAQEIDGKAIIISVARVQG